MARPRSQQSGFVLVVVLAVLVALAILAAAAARSGERAVANALADQARFQAELDQTSTRETLLFMLASHPRTLAGLSVNYSQQALNQMDPEQSAVLPQGNEIRLDGRAYAGLGASAFAIQDDRGLLGINWATDLVRGAFYASLGAEAKDWPQLDDERLDYQDPDDLRRLNGAEAREYQKQGLPPPANRTLTSPLELRQLPHWAPLLAKLDDESLLSTLTATRTTLLNLNTAPAPVLALLPGMTRAEAERMVASRQNTPFVSFYDVRRSFPISPMLDEMLSLFPSQSGNLMLWDRQSGTKRLLHWTLTPMGDTATPWRIDYEVTLPRGNQSNRPVAGTPQTPLFSTQDPDRQPAGLSAPGR